MYVLLKKLKVKKYKPRLTKLSGNSVVFVLVFLIFAIRFETG